MIGDRPVYRFGGRDQTVVYADTGDFYEGMSTRTRQRTWRAATPLAIPAPSATLKYLTAPDQWTLQARNELPMHVFALDDEQATHLYVSEVTGDVELRTTSRERFWGYLGPVLHWVYFTPLRRNGPLWSEFIIWSSLIGCVMCVTGIVWGLWRFSPRSTYRLKRIPSTSPYAGLDEVASLRRPALRPRHADVDLQRSALDGTVQLVQISAPRRRRARGVDRRAAEAGAHDRGQHAGGGGCDRGSFAPKELETMQFRGEPFWAATAHRLPTRRACG